MLACETIKTLYGIPISFDDSDSEPDSKKKKEEGEDV